MPTEHQTVRIKKTTLSKLRLIYGITEEKMVDILDRLVTEELAKVQAANNQHSERGA